MSLANLISDHVSSKEAFSESLELVEAMRRPLWEMVDIYQRLYLIFPATRSSSEDEGISSAI